MDCAAAGFSHAVGPLLPRKGHFHALIGSTVATALDENLAHQPAHSKKCQQQDDLKDFRRHATNSIAKRKTAASSMNPYCAGLDPELR
jgi:hypothetical protein